MELQTCLQLQMYVLRLTLRNGIKTKSFNHISVGNLTQNYKFDWIYVITYFLCTTFLDSKD